ncbi:hypothetical protein D3C76_692800 [compost metagenome]
MDVEPVLRGAGQQRKSGGGRVYVDAKKQANNQADAQDDPPATSVHECLQTRALRLAKSMRSTNERALSFISRRVL